MVAHKSTFNATTLQTHDICPSETKATCYIYIQLYCLNLLKMIPSIRDTMQNDSGLNTVILVYFFMCHFANL